MEELLERINELARTAKERELTEEELEEQARLRKEYIEEFRSGLKDMLLNTKVVDSKGNDVTPRKLRQAQSKKKKVESTDKSEAPENVCKGNRFEVETIVREAQVKLDKKEKDIADEVDEK